VITSTEREDAVPITERSLVEGKLKTYPSYVSSWSLHVFPDQEITKRVAEVETETMRTVAEQIRAFTRVL